VPFSPVEKTAVKGNKRQPIFHVRKHLELQRCGGLREKSTIGRYKQALKCEARSQFAFGRVGYHVDVTEHPELQVDLSGSAIPMPGIAVWERGVSLEGDPKTKIIDFAKEWGADLVVVGCSAPGPDSHLGLRHLRQH
jgi:hypothetical protein